MVLALQTRAGGSPRRRRSKRWRDSRPQGRSRSPSGSPPRGWSRWPLTLIALGKAPGLMSTGTTVQPAVAWLLPDAGSVESRRNRRDVVRVSERRRGHTKRDRDVLAPLWNRPDRAELTLPGTGDRARVGGERSIPSDRVAVCAPKRKRARSSPLAVRTSSTTNLLPGGPAPDSETLRVQRNDVPGVQNAEDFRDREVRRRRVLEGERRASHASRCRTRSREPARPARIVADDQARLRG